MLQFVNKNIKRFLQLLFFCSARVRLLKEVSRSKKKIEQWVLWIMKVLEFKDWCLKRPYHSVVDPRQMFYPTIRVATRTTPVVAFMVHLGILYRTHVEPSHGELRGVKQHAITMWTRFIVLMTRKLLVPSFQKPHQNRFSRLSRVRVSPLMHRRIN